MQDDRQLRLAELERQGQMAAAMVEHLGRGWEHAHDFGADNDPMYRRDRLKGPNGEDINVRLGGYDNQGRYRFAGMFPWGNRHGQYSPRGEKHSITAAEGKTADQLAKEVERRLLKDYTPAVLAAYKKKAEDEQTERDQHSAMDAIQEAVGYAPSNRTGRQNYSNETAIHFYTDNGPTGTFRTYSGRDFQLELRGVPYEMALKIAAMFKPGVQAHEAKEDERKGRTSAAREEAA